MMSLSCSVLLVMIQVNSFNLGKYKVGICMSHLKAVQADHSPHLHQQPSYQGPIVHAESVARGD